MFASKCRRVSKSVTLCDKWRYFRLWSVAYGGSKLAKCYRIEAIAAILTITLTEGHYGRTN
jgi:hypothetical protein